MLDLLQSPALNRRCSGKKLWLLTILAVAAAGWRVVRWAVRVFFAWPKHPVVQSS